MSNRVTPYEAGWLSMLVARGLATEAEAREAQHRVARAAIDEMEARRAAKRELKKRLKGRRPKDD
jgi:hypothetical protein